MTFSHSNVLIPIPMHLISIPVHWLIVFQFQWESHGTHGIPVFPIPMHISSVNQQNHTLVIVYTICDIVTVIFYGTSFPLSNICLSVRAFMAHFLYEL